MYRILHIPTGTFLRLTTKDPEKGPGQYLNDYPIYESRFKIAASKQINDLINDWSNTDTILEEELQSYFQNEPYWQEKACERIRDKSEFEIVKV